MIVRELLLGPRRYTDLNKALPGLSPTLLADRPRELERSGIVMRTEVEPPAASVIYELSELGEELRPLMSELYRWGLHVLSEPLVDDSFRAGWLLAALETAADEGLVPDDALESYEFRVGGERIAVRVGGGRVTVSQGAASDVAVVVHTDHATLIRLGTARTTISQALANGTMSVEGDPDAGARCARLFGVLPTEADNPGAREERARVG